MELCKWASLWGAFDSKKDLNKHTPLRSDGQTSTNAMQESLLRSCAAPTRSAVAVVAAAAACPFASCPCWAAHYEEAFFFSIRCCRRTTVSSSVSVLVALESTETPACLIREDTKVCPMRRSKGRRLDWLAPQNTWTILREEPQATTTSSSAYAARQRGSSVSNESGRFG